MAERRRILIVSMMTLAFVTLLVSASVVTLLYRTAIDQQRERLRESVQSQASLIEAITRFDALHSTEAHLEEDPRSATLSQIIDSHKHFKGFGETGEFTLAERQGDKIVFLLSRRHADLDDPKPVPWDSAPAEPMRRALSGQSGTCIALDYRGELVLAAYEPVHELRAGLVSKIDLSEVRAPFVYAGVLTCAITLLGIVIGSFIIFQYTGPLVFRIAQAEQKTQAILDHANEIILTLDDRGAIQSTNIKAQHLSGYTEEELLGLDADLLVSASGPSDRNHFFKALVGEGGIGPEGHRQEIRVRRKDGSDFPVRATVNRVASVSDPLFVVIMHDLTDEKVLQSQLTHAQKMESVGQLASGIAHEINTPMQYIGDNAGFIKDSLGGLLTIVQKYFEQLDPSTEAKSWAERSDEINALIKQLDLDFLREEMPQAIDQALEGVRRVATIVQAMKSFSHPGAGQKEPVDLNRAIESTVTVCRNRWKYVADLETDFDPSLPQVPCLINEFNQVILNLLVNAADAIDEVTRENSKAKGKITVTTRLDGDRVEIRVSDTGVGIPEKMVGKVFDPFFTTKDVGKGTGQGLTICHDVIVNKHDGSIAIDTVPGRGTTFILHLPVVGESSERHKGAA